MIVTMERTSFLLSCIGTFLLLDTCVAFTSIRRVSSSTSALASTTTSDRIVKAGGGIPIVPSGDCRLFDPELEGKLNGSGSINQRIAKGINFQFITHNVEQMTPHDILNDDIATLSAQNWLLEDSPVPLNFAKNSAPVAATLLGRTRLIGADAPGDIQHIVLQLPEGMHYVEGQSISVIPPGLTEKGKPHKPRLYSIASTRYGDTLDGRTVSLCVRRAQYVDPITNQVDPSKQGICSNFLCNADKGQTVQVAGPVGKTMLLPADLETTDVILVATGTGIAPFRGFLHRLFMEETVDRHMYQGTAWLILGVPTTSSMLYKEELDAMQANAQGMSAVMRDE